MGWKTYRAIYVRTSQNRSGITNADTVYFRYIPSLQQEPFMYSAEGKIQVFYEYI